MRFSQFSLKVVLFSVIPLGLSTSIILMIQLHEVKTITESATEITDKKAQAIYEAHLRSQSESIADKVKLRLDAIENELNILRGSAQLMIDQPALAELGKKVADVDFFRNHFVYNTQQHWANLPDSDSDISMSIWGYLLKPDGQMDETTRKHVDFISGIKPLLFSIGHYGMPKGWLYIVGPKSTPVMTMTPWAQMPAIFDKEYPGHNTRNWWDFFFPGIVEGWEAWLPDLAPPRQQVTLTPLYKDAGGTGMMVTFFAPLWSADRSRNEGSAALDYNLNNLVELVKNERAGRQGFSFLMEGSDGAVLGLKQEWAKTLGLSEQKSVDSGVTQSYFKLSESKNDVLRRLAGELNGDEPSLHTFVDSRGERYLIAFKKITDFNRWFGQGPTINRDALYLGSVIPLAEIGEVREAIQSEIATIADRSQRSMLLIALGVGFLVAGIAVIFALRQTRQMRLLNAAVQAVRNQDLETQVDIIANDDLGGFASAFNMMVHELHESYRKTYLYNQSLEAKVKERTTELEEKNAKLEYLSITDPLTRLYNRHKLDQVLESEHQRFLRSKLAFSVILLDIDHFKLVNDRHGHSVGDDVLQHISDILQRNSRQTDSVGRWGGEEFLIICPYANLEGALNLAEKLRIAIESHDFPQVGHITASFGVTEYRSDDNESRVVSRADDALYKAKNAGRNRVFGLSSA